MITVDYSPVFKRQFRKLPPSQRRQFDERLRLFLINRADPRLRNHPLKGSYYGFWSINVNGDIRALYQNQGGNFVLFAFIGSHSELYG